MKFHPVKSNEGLNENDLIIKNKHIVHISNLDSKRVSHFLVEERRVAVVEQPHLKPHCVLDSFNVRGYYIVVYMVLQNFVENA